MSGSTGEPQWFVDGNVSVSITRTVTPRIVDARVHGVDNSPWVQSCLLALHEHSARGVRLTATPTLDTLRANGAIIPTVQLRFDDGSAITIAGSFNLLRYLEEARAADRRASGYGEDDADDTAEECDAFQAQLEGLFFDAAFERFYPLREKLWRFPLLFARQPDSPRSESWLSTIYCEGLTGLLSAFAKAFLLVNFGCSLMAGAVLHAATGHPAVDNASRKEKQLDYFYRLRRGSSKAGPFLFGADKPSMLDIALFGQLQMCFSGLSEDMACRIVARPELASFISRMNKRFEGYAFNNYCGRVVLPASSVASSTSGSGSPSPSSSGSGAHVLPENSRPIGGAPEEEEEEEVNPPAPSFVLESTWPGRKQAPLLHVAVTLGTLAMLLTFWLLLLLLFLGVANWLRARNGEASGKKLGRETYWGRLLLVPSSPLGIWAAFKALKDDFP